MDFCSQVPVRAHRSVRSLCFRRVRSALPSLAAATVLLAVSVGAGVPARAQTAPLYTLIELGQYMAPTNGQTLTSINNAGQIAGTSGSRPLRITPRDIDGDGKLDCYADANNDGRGF